MLYFFKIFCVWEIYCVGVVIIILLNLFIKMNFLIVWIKIGLLLIFKNCFGNGMFFIFELIFFVKIFV